MSRLVTCPQCHFDFRPQALTSGIEHCPYCEHEFAVEVAERSSTDEPDLPPIVQPEPDARSGPQSRRGNRSGGRGDPGVLRESPWRTFASGSSWVMLGLLIELASTTVISLLLLAYISVIADPNPGRGGAAGLVWNPFLVIRLMMVGLLIGSLLVALGRTLQVSVPSGLGIGGTLWVSAGLAWLAFVATAAGVVLIYYAVTDGRATGEHYKHAGVCFLVASIARWLADVAAATALRLASRVLSSSRLRMCARGLTVVLLVLALYCASFLGLDVTGANVADVMETADGLTRGMAVLAVGYFLVLIYSLLNISLYSAARRAALES